MPFVGSHVAINTHPARRISTIFYMAARSCQRKWAFANMANHFQCVQPSASPGPGLGRGRRWPRTQECAAFNRSRMGTPFCIEMTNITKFTKLSSLFSFTRTKSPASTTIMQAGRGQQKSNKVFSIVPSRYRDLWTSGRLAIRRRLRLGPIMRWNVPHRLSASHMCVRVIHT